MRYIGIFVVMGLVYFTEVRGLECGIGRSKSDKLNQAISVCIKHNRTLAKLWDKTASTLTSMEPSEESNESGEKVSKFSPQSRKVSSYRHKRATKNRNYHENEDTISTTEMPSSEDDNNNRSNSKNSGEKESTPCVVQCIFQNLEMTDSNGFPDHKKIVEGLISTASRREVRDFLQDSTDECFQETETENSDSCAQSSAIITCLAEKGRENCSDWPVGNLPF